MVKVNFYLWEKTQTVKQLLDQQKSYPVLKELYIPSRQTLFGVFRAHFRGIRKGLQFAKRSRSISC